MKAIQLIKYGSSKDSFEINEIPIPNLINMEDILIKVHAFGINFADIMARKAVDNLRRTTGATTDQLQRMFNQLNAYV